MSHQEVTLGAPGWLPPMEEPTLKHFLHFLLPLSLFK